MFRKLFTGLSLFLMLFGAAFSEVGAQGFPPLPHAFFGRAYINGNLAPVGTQIEARGENVLVDITGNPIEVLAEGFYGSTDNTTINLVVQGDMTEGTPIEFYVNGQKAYCNDGSGWEESYPYQAGGITALDLWVGALSTQAVIPTATKTPTFAPTVPRTATSTAGPSSPDAATPTVMPIGQEISTGTPTRTIEAGLAIATVLVETDEYQQTAVSDNISQVQEEPTGASAGLVVGIVIGTLIILVVIWLVFHNRRKARSKDNEDLL